MRNYAPNGNILSGFSYSYDANGNCTSIVTPAGTIQYQYDALNRLTRESYPDGKVIEYSYDNAGNRLAKRVTVNGNQTITNYSYDAADQLTSVNGQPYTYDPNGNLTSDGSKTYTYDAQNRLTQVKSGTSIIASFTCDADGKRTSATTSSGAITFLYDRDRVVAELDAGNNVIARYTYNAAGQLVSMARGGQTYYYHFNGRGDVIALTDNNGNVAASYEYDAWGNITGSTGSVVNPYRYAGYWYDEVTGLYYVDGGYYNPEIAIIYNESSNNDSEEKVSTIYKAKDQKILWGGKKVAKAIIKRAIKFLESEKSLEWAKKYIPRSIYNLLNKYRKTIAQALSKLLKWEQVFMDNIKAIVRDELIEAGVSVKNAEHVGWFVSRFIDWFV